VINRTTRNTLCVLVPLLLTLGACGDDDTSTTEAVTTIEAAPTSEAPTTTEAATTTEAPTTTSPGTVIPPRTVDIAADQQDIIIYGEDPADSQTGIPDFLGMVVVASADFNGDGIDDALIGSGGADGPANTRFHAGEAYVIFGSTELEDKYDVADIEGPEPDIRIYGEETGIGSRLPFAPGDSLGEVVTAGDLNGDGFDDIVVCSLLADGPGNSRPDAGAVHIIFGRSQEDWDSLRPSPDEPIIFDVAGAAGLRPEVNIEGRDEEDVLGSAVATGDVDNDGIDDLLAGAYYADGPGNTRSAAGDAYLFLGRSTADWEAISPIDLGVSPQSADVAFFGVNDNDMAGISLTSGNDVNGDGVVDLVIGAAYADGAQNGLPDAGEAHLLFGRDTADWLALDPVDLASTPADVTIWGAETSGNLTGFTALAMGDANGDGIGDVLIGAPGAGGPSGQRNAAGVVYGFFGRTTWPTTIDLTGTSADFSVFGEEADDHFGTAISCGDVDGDGLADGLFGATGVDGPGNARVDSAGAAYLISGSLLDGVMDLATTSAAQITVFGADAGDWLGAISAGDLNGDGVPDLLVGANSADGPNEARTDAGEAYVIYGP
jgi:hypothetical protein